MAGGNGSDDKENTTAKNITQIPALQSTKKSWHEYINVLVKRYPERAVMVLRGWITKGSQGK